MSKVILRRRADGGWESWIDGFEHIVLAVSTTPREAAEELRTYIRDSALAFASVTGVDLTLMIHRFDTAVSDAVSKAGA